MAESYRGDLRQSLHLRADGDHLNKLGLSSSTWQAMWPALTRPMALELRSSRGYGGKSTLTTTRRLTNCMSTTYCGSGTATSATKNVASARTSACMRRGSASRA